MRYSVKQNPKDREDLRGPCDRADYNKTALANCQHDVRGVLDLTAVYFPTETRSLQRRQWSRSLPVYNARSKVRAGIEHQADWRWQSHHPNSRRTERDADVHEREIQKHGHKTEG